MYRIPQRFIISVYGIRKNSLKERFGLELSAIYIYGLHQNQ